MAIVMDMSWKGVTREQYEATRRIVRWDTDIAPGGLAHVSWFDGDALRVVDLWESAEQFQAFVEQRLMPGVQQVGIETQPEVRIFPAHAAFTAPAFRPFQDATR